MSEASSGWVDYRGQPGPYVPGPYVPQDQIYQGHRGTPYGAPGDPKGGKQGFTWDLVEHGGRMWWHKPATNEWTYAEAYLQPQAGASKGKGPSHQEVGGKGGKPGPTRAPVTEHHTNPYMGLSLIHI